MVFRTHEWSAPPRQVDKSATVPQRRAIGLVPLSAAPAAEKAARIVTSSTDYELDEPHMSPNGRWVAFIAIKGSASGSQVMVVATGGGAWTHRRGLVVGR